MNYKNEYPCTSGILHSQSLSTSLGDVLQYVVQASGQWLCDGQV